MLARFLQPSVATAFLVALPFSLVVSGMVPSGHTPTATSGIVALAFFDVNGDGRHDPSLEPVLTDWRLCLDTPVERCATPSGGFFTWWLEETHASVRADAPEGYELTTPAVQNIDLTAGRVVTVRFGARYADHSRAR